MKFVDPPGERRGGIKYMTPDVRQALDARPGEWALLIEGGPSSARISVSVWCKRHEGYETTCRKTPAKTFDIYVRRIKEQ